MSRLTLLIAPLLLAASTTPAAAQRNEIADRAAIHALLVEYGATLDSRDFDGFGKLFGADGVYIAGSGTEAKGPAISEMMRQIFAVSPRASRQPNFHLFFNEVVTFEGRDRARATSMSLWMVPDDNNRPAAALSARYEDELVRKQGRWLFARRVVKAITNQPAVK